MLVTLTGRNVVLTNLVNALAVADIGDHRLTVDFSDYEDFDVRITNTHDQPVRFWWEQTGSGLIYVAKLDGTIAPYFDTSGAAYHEVPGNNVQNMFLSDFGLDTAIYKEANPWKKYKHALKLVYSFQTAPTSGSITIDILGVPN